jgi:hypothetical protein
MRPTAGGGGGIDPLSPPTFIPTFSSYVPRCMHMHCEVWRLTVAHAVEQARARSAQLQGRCGPISNRERVARLQTRHDRRRGRNKITLPKVSILLPPD